MINEDMPYDVKVTSAFKSYGRKKVFNGLNMNVMSGSM